MVDFDEILAAAIQIAWLQVNGPEPRLPYQIEAETVRRIRAALESEHYRVSLAAFHTGSSPCSGRIICAGLISLRPAFSSA
jgi:hypothetical protein